MLRSPRYLQVAQIPVVANVPTEDRTLVIYRNIGDVARGPHMVDLHLPIIGKSIEGVVGR